MEEKKKVKNFNIDLIKGFFCKENLPLICLICLGIFAVVAILVSHLAFHVSVIAACFMVVLEALLGACLNRIPLWIHGLVFIAQIVAGIMASQVPFMILMAFIYVFSIAFLFIWAGNE